MHKAAGRSDLERQVPRLGRPHVTSTLAAGRPCFPRACLEPSAPPCLCHGKRAAAAATGNVLRSIVVALSLLRLKLLLAPSSRLARLSVKRWEGSASV